MKKSILHLNIMDNLKHWLQYRNMIFYCVIMLFTILWCINILNGRNNYHVSYRYRT